MTVSTDFAYIGAQSLKWSLVVFGPSTTVVAGSTYALSGYVYQASGSDVLVSAALRWRDGSDEILSDSEGWATAVTDTWTRVSVVGDAPATAASVIPVFQNSEQAAGYLYLDAVLLEESPVVGDYFDGSMSRGSADDYVWLGTAHASISGYYPDRVLRTSRLIGTAPDYTPHGIPPVLRYATAPLTS